MYLTRQDVSLSQKTKEGVDDTPNIDRWLASSCRCMDALTEPSSLPVEVDETNITELIGIFVIDSTQASSSSSNNSSQNTTISVRLEIHSQL
jgi:hypothetical protein